LYRFGLSVYLQLLDLFDPEMAASERLRAAEMLYARCINPLDFWLTALPTMPLAQVSVVLGVIKECRGSTCMLSCSGRWGCVLVSNA
jgi:hypothetical protein